MKVLTILEYFWDDCRYQESYFGCPEEGTVGMEVEDFWFDWDFQEKTREEIRTELIDSGCDPDAAFRSVKKMINDFKANREMELSLKGI